MTATCDANVIDPSSPSHSNQLISTNGIRAKRVDARGIPAEVFEQLTKMCRMSRDERCGFITNKWEVETVLNVHDEPTHNFYMDEEDTKQVVEDIYNRGEHIIAIWHTHPNGVPWPSPRDIRGWPNLRLGWRYFIATGNKLLEWSIS